MTSRIFYCSRQRAMHVTQEILHELKLRKEFVDNSNNRIQASRGWKLFSPSKEVEIIMYADEHRVEVAVNVESHMNALDFGTNEYLEEEILLRLRDRLN